MNSDIKIRLVVAGDGEDLCKVDDYLEKNGLNFVGLVGYVKEDEKARLLSTAHIFLFPTEYGEGLPIVVLEAMLYGLPIITRSVGGIPDIVKNGRMVILQIARYRVCLQT